MITETVENEFVELLYKLLHTEKNVKDSEALPLIKKTLHNTLKLTNINEQRRNEFEAMLKDVTFDNKLLSKDGFVFGNGISEVITFFTDIENEYKEKLLHDESKKTILSDVFTKPQ